MIIIGSQCGARVGPSELLQLTWADVDLELGILRVHGAKKNLAAQWREVPIRQSLLPAFQAWREADSAKGIQYLISYKGKQVQSIRKAWTAALANARITRRIRPYDLRHAFATQLIIGAVAKLMGHSGPAMLLPITSLSWTSRSGTPLKPCHNFRMCPNKKGVTDLQ